MFGSRHSCLAEFRFRVGVRTLAAHVLFCCVSVQSRVHSGHALSCPRVLLCFVPHVVRVRPRAFSLSCVVAHGLGFPRPCAFMLCVNTWLMRVLIGCVFVSCFAHGW